MIKLKATTNKDLKVIASLVQDAILPIGDFAYFKAESKIMFALNRYCWENKLEKQRSNSVLTILDVRNIQTKNIDMTDRKKSLYLLDIEGEDNNVILTFSDNKKIKINVDKINLSLVDTGEQWNIYQEPNHN